MTLSRRANYLVLVAASLSWSFSSVAFAGSTKDLSGTYVSETVKRKVSEPPVVLRIVQTADQIEIRHNQNGKVTVSTFPLDGSPGVYTTPTGSTSKGFAHWKGADLVIETLLTAPPQGGKTIRFHTTERWQLSGDGKTLKVRVETDSPDMPPEIVAAAIQPYALVYHRDPAIP